LLAADGGRRDEEIVRTVSVSLSTVGRTKRRFVEGNLERALSEEPRPGAERKVTGKEEALLVATACAKPPAGRKRWTLTLLADTMVKLTDHNSLSGETVRRRLAENDLKPWRRDMWCIPKVDGEYVARMEDVLDLYAETPNPARPLVCFDETPVQLIGEVRQPVPAQPGRRERYDYEYRRNGTANLFVTFDPHRGWRNVKITDRRAAVDYAHCMRDLVDVHYPDAALHPCRAGQFVDPQAWGAVRGLRARRGPTHPAPPRIPLHPEARQLAQYGRVRDQRAATPVSRPPHRRPQKAPKRDRSMAKAAE
jgi:transposase